MSAKKGPKPRQGEEFEITVDGLAYGGRGVGRLPGPDGRPGMAVFVGRTAPGDRARVRIDRVQRRYAEATVVELLSAGRGRVEPSCPHYAEGCGGCSWQHLSYEAQLEAKEREVRDSLERLGGFVDPPITPIVAAGEPWYYRNKMEFTFNANDGLGLHVAGNWRRVVPITDCRLESELAMRIVELARAFVTEHELTSWNPEDGEGFLHELVIRHGRGSGETLVGLVTGDGEFPEGPEFADRLATLDASIVSVVRAIRSTQARGSTIREVEVLGGRETIVERVGGLEFNLGLQTFFQTNTAQAEQMLRIVRERVSEGLRPIAAERGDTSILDVFCGVGFFSVELADLAGEVIGVEIVEASIAAAKDNAADNGVDNAYFYAGDARRTLPDVIERHGSPDLVLLDPPRGGAGGKVMRRIARTGPSRIVYVSCNPTTLARDLTELEPFGYRITAVEPIDLFPQTYHVETIVTVDRDPAAVSAADTAAPDDDGAPGSKNENAPPA
jgi:23S rRNA (uracil1939-C5)-methyltransferase